MASIGLNQQWNMFAKSNLFFNKRVKVYGITNTGETINILKEQNNLNIHLIEVYGGHYWRQFFIRLASLVKDERELLLFSYSNYLCETRKDKHLKGINIFIYQNKINLSNKKRPEEILKYSYSHFCNNF